MKRRKSVLKTAKTFEYFIQFELSLIKLFLFHLGDSEPNEQDNFCCTHFLPEKGLNADHLDYSKRIHKSNATNMVLEIIVFAILLKMPNSINVKVLI